MPSEMVLIPVAVLAAFFVGNALFKRYSSESHTLSATFGLVRNISMILVGVFTMIGGTEYHFAAGMILISAGWYLGRGHKEQLDESTSSGSLRAKING